VLPLVSSTDERVSIRNSPLRRARYLGGGGGGGGEEGGR
jgi:hypothetical protein